MAKPTYTDYLKSNPPIKELVELEKGNTILYCFLNEDLKRYGYTSTDSIDKIDLENKIMYINKSFEPFSEFTKHEVKYEYLFIFRLNLGAFNHILEKVSL